MYQETQSLIYETENLFDLIYDFGLVYYAKQYEIKIKRTKIISQITVFLRS